MALTLHYTGSTTVPVEVEGITPDAVRELSLDSIARLPVFHGNEPATVGDFFRLEGNAADGELIFAGNLAGVHWIGAKMTAGTLRVLGAAGRHVGSEMRGGEIHVHGNVGDWLGGEMHGGLIHVRGNAGHLVGAAYRGSARGMTRGTLLVEGSAGNEIGQAMRRGLIVVGGTAGDLLGFNMLAGTILVFGECGIRPGAGMKRGTLGLLGAGSVKLLPTYRRACRFRPGMFALMLAEIRRRGFPLPQGALQGEVELFRGDFLAGGRGEILRPAASTIC